MECFDRRHAFDKPQTHAPILAGRRHAVECATEIIINGHSGVEPGPAYAELEADYSEQKFRYDSEIDCRCCRCSVLQNRSSDFLPDSSEQKFRNDRSNETLRTEVQMGHFMGLDTHYLHQPLQKPVTPHLPTRGIHRKKCFEPMEGIARKSTLAPVGSLWEWIPILRWGWIPI